MPPIRLTLVSLDAAQMTFNVQQVAGLNPKGFRLFRAKSPAHQAQRKNIVDGDLVWQ